MEDFTFAQDAIIHKIEKKSEDTFFQDHHYDYSDDEGGNYGDSSGDWT